MGMIILIMAMIMAMGTIIPIMAMGTIILRMGIKITAMGTIIPMMKIKKGEVMVKEQKQLRF